MERHAIYVVCLMNHLAALVCSGSPLDVYAMTRPGMFSSFEQMRTALQTLKVLQLGPEILLAVLQLGPSEGLHQPEDADEQDKALMVAMVKRRKLYRQLTGQEVPWFPHNNDGWPESMRYLCDIWSALEQPLRFNLPKKETRCISSVGRWRLHQPSAAAGF